MTLTSGQSHVKPISAFALISWAILLVLALIFLLLQKDPTRD